MHAGRPRRSFTKTWYYTLELTYAFDRAAAKKRCDPKWKPLDDPEQPWNQALELKHTFRIELRVQPPR